MSFFDDLPFWPGSKSLSARWRSAKMGQRDALRLDLRRRFSGIAKDKSQKMGFAGEAIFWAVELDLDQRLEVFETAFARSLASLAAPENDWREADFERHLAEWFGRECWRVWADALAPPRFAQLFRASSEAERERMRVFLADKMEPLRRLNFSAHIGGKRRLLGDWLSKDERDEPFSTALEQLFEFLEKRFEGTASIETNFRKIFYRRCVDAARKKTTGKKDAFDAVPSDLLDLEAALAEPSEGFDAERLLFQDLLEFERADLSEAIRIWRREHFPCFFLIASRTIRGVAAADIFESLQNLDDPSDSIWLELNLAPPPTEAEIAQIRNIWNSVQVVRTMARNCLLQFKNRFFPDEAD